MDYDDDDDVFGDMDFDQLAEARLLMARFQSSEQLKKKIKEYIDSVLERQRKEIDSWESHHEKIINEINEDIKKAKNNEEEEEFRKELERADKYINEGGIELREKYEKGINSRNNNDYSFFYNPNDKEHFLYPNFTVLEERKNENKNAQGGKNKRRYTKKNKKTNSRRVKKYGKNKSRKH